MKIKIETDNGYIKQISEIAQNSKLNAYIVGGTVRDLLTGRKNCDIDVVVEKKTGILAKKFAKINKAAIISHQKFGTFVVKLKDGSHVDFATARCEVYPRSGSLPVVKFSTIKKDLFRRDFTINSLAYGLSGKDSAEIVDLYGGITDLKNKRLRVIHTGSFKDDPTRIFRLARFASRGYTIEPNTEKLAKNSVTYIRNISRQRVREEIIAILNEKKPSKALCLLSKWKALGFVFPNGNKSKFKKLDRLKAIEQKFSVLFEGLKKHEIKKIVEDLCLERGIKNKIIDLMFKKELTVLNGDDLIILGYKPGPEFKNILETVKKKSIKSRQKAIRFVIDNFSPKS